VSQIALEVWELAQVQGPFKADLLFLVERLTYYNIVPVSRKKALLQEIRRAGGKFEDLGNTELENRFNDFLPDLQPMQTRHFVRPRNGRS